MYMCLKNGRYILTNVLTMCLSVLTTITFCHVMSRVASAQTDAKGCVLKTPLVKEKELNRVLEKLMRTEPHMRQCGGD